jgi:DNA-binding GntR family transcriptional regulator
MRSAGAPAQSKAAGAPPLVDRIATQIKNSIVVGDLRPGEKFSIGDLASRLAVSHIPVREALRRLEADGLIELRPGRSAIVARLNLEEVDELYRLRRLIEVDLAGRAAPSYSDQQLSVMADACERLLSSDPAPEMGGPDAHHQLHQVLLMPAAGPHTLRTIEQLMDIADRYIRLVQDPRPRELDAPYRRHRILVEAAELRSGPAIAEALATHLTESLACIKTRLALDVT